MPPGNRWNTRSWMIENDLNSGGFDFVNNLSVMKEKKKTKYDTNPLDPDYAGRADESWGEPRPVEPLPKCRKWKSAGPAEAPTKRYDSSIPVSYPSINVPPSYPPKVADACGYVVAFTARHHPSALFRALVCRRTSRWRLPYTPFFIGAVAGVLELFLTPRAEPRARFHAAQGLALQLAAVAIKLIFNIIESITGNNAGGKLFWAAFDLLFIIAMIRVWKGESVHVAAVDDATAWLNERIDPQKIPEEKSSARGLPSLLLLISPCYLPLRNISDRHR